MKLRNGRDVLIFDEMITNAAREHSKYWEEYIISCIKEHKYTKKKKYLLDFSEFVYLYCIDNWLLHIPIPSYEEFNNFYDNIYVAGLRALITYGIRHNFHVTNTKAPTKTRREILIKTILEIQKEKEE